MLTSRPTHGGGAPFGIDLDAGTAKITVRRPAVPAAEAPGTEPAPGLDAAVTEPASTDVGPAEAGPAASGTAVPGTPARDDADESRA